MQNQDKTKRQWHAPVLTHTGSFFQVSIDQSYTKSFDQPGAIVEDPFPRCFSMRLNSALYGWKANSSPCGHIIKQFLGYNKDIDKIHQHFLEEKRTSFINLVKLLYLEKLDLRVYNCAHYYFIVLVSMSSYQHEFEHFLL